LTSGAFNSEANSKKIQINITGSNKISNAKNWYCGSASSPFLNANGAEYITKPKASPGKTVYAKWIPQKNFSANGYTPTGSSEMFLTAKNDCGPGTPNADVTNTTCLALAPTILSYLSALGGFDYQIELDARATLSGLNPNGDLVGTLEVWEQ
ncbi:MAG: hypothetical protein NT003_01570, partial [Candidatus Magasanikbacteria bacterium]|nr:hypothetical protein [Candidatus Magasanikbacteria bacterium]